MQKVVGQRARLLGCPGIGALIVGDLETVVVAEDADKLQFLGFDGFGHS